MCEAGAVPGAKSAPITFFAAAAAAFDPEVYRQRRRIVLVTKPIATKIGK